MLAGRLVTIVDRDAMKQIRGEVRLEIVPGATHLFEEPGTLERVAELAGVWFERHFQAAVAARHGEPAVEASARRR